MTEGPNVAKVASDLEVETNDRWLYSVEVESADLDGLLAVLAQMPRITGMKMATTPVELMKARICMVLCLSFVLVTACRPFLMRKAVRGGPLPPPTPDRELPLELRMQGDSSSYATTSVLSADGRLLLIRLASTQYDDLFSAERVVAPTMRNSGL